MGFLSNIVGAVVDVALSPLDMISDVVNVGDGEESKTVKRLENAGKKVAQAIDDLV